MLTESDCCEYPRSIFVDFRTNSHCRSSSQTCWPLAWTSPSPLAALQSLPPSASRPPQVSGGFASPPISSPYLLLVSSIPLRSRFDLTRFHLTVAIFCHCSASTACRQSPWAPLSLVKADRGARAVLEGISFGSPRTAVFFLAIELIGRNESVLTEMIAMIVC